MTPARNSVRQFPAVVSFALALTAGAAGAQETTTSPRSEDYMTQWLDAAVQWTAPALEIAGIAAIVFGAALATGIYLYQAASGGPQEAHYDRFRSRLGRSILLGLEFLVAADIIATVAIDPTLTNLAVLAGIVLIRTFLSFTLEAEIEGKWPWQKRERQ